MFSALHRLSRQLMNLTLATCLGLCFMLTACSGAGASTLSGDYVEDTVAVVHTLQSTIAMAQDAEGRAEAETAATDLINDYMSRYRPRPQVNGLSSFTTMQTALNSLAGHYKTYANRPLPETLRARVDKELGKAEKAAVRGS
ncbi:MAG: photosystem II protein Psb27 [Synechococcus sp.]